MVVHHVICYVSGTKNSLREHKSKVDRRTATVVARCTTAWEMYLQKRSNPNCSYWSLNKQPKICVLKTSGSTIVNPVKEMLGYLSSPSMIRTTCIVKVQWKFKSNFYIIGLIS